MNFTVFLTEIKAVTGAFKQFRGEMESLAGAGGGVAGMRAVNKQFDLLAGSIGQVLMPALQLVAAAAGTVADAFTAALTQNIGLLTPIFVMMAVDLVTFTSQIVEATQALGGFIKWLKENYPEVKAAAGLALNPFGIWAKVIKGEIGPNAAGGGGGANGGAGGGMDEGILKVLGDFIKNLEGQIQDQVMSMNRPGFGSIADAWKRIQLSSFISPLDQKKLEQAKTGIDLMKTIITELRRLLKPAVGN